MAVRSNIQRRVFLAGLLAKRGFEDELDELRVRYHIPGLAVAVLEKQRAVLMRGFGDCDLEAPRPVTPQTPFRIASLTKTFTSVLLMQLYEAGKVDLDGPIGPFLPAGNAQYAPLQDRAVRIRHVASHTSEPPPGTSYRYSGARFAALGSVIEKAAGASFRDLLVRRILDPLHMARSVPGQDSREERYQAALRELAKPYVWKDGRFVPAEYPPRGLSAAAGLVSTVEDLAKYDAAIDRHELIRRETLEQAWTPARRPDGKPLPYAIGWFVQDNPRLVWHYGWWPDSFSALYLKVPAAGRTLFLLANTDGLSRPFPLWEGDVRVSDFARLFLQHFGTPRDRITLP